MLTLERVSKTYKVGLFGGTELAAVRDVSFSLQPGEVISLIGESGSGKSTIGKMILRLLSVNGGTITDDGTDIATLRGAALRSYYQTVQGVFQDPFSSFNPIFKADHVFGLIRGVYFGSASATAWQSQLEDALKARGLGILFITHDLSLGNYISERTVILRRGRIVEMGATGAVFGRPIHPYTRMLIAAVPRLHEKWGQIDAGVRAGSGWAPAPGERCLFHAAVPD